MKNYTIRAAVQSDEDTIIKLARRVTDVEARVYLGDAIVNWYLNSRACDNDIKKDLPNMLVLIEGQTVIGIMVWHGALLHLLMLDIPHHGTGAAHYFCNAIIPNKLEEFGTIYLECFEKNERGNSFYRKTGWVAYDKTADVITGGNRVLYRMSKDGKKE